MFRSFLLLFASQSLQPVINTLEYKLRIEAHMSHKKHKDDDDDEQNRKSTFSIHPTLSIGKSLVSGSFIRWLLTRYNNKM